MIVIGDFIGQVGQLRFQRWLLLFEKTLADVAEFLGMRSGAML